MRRTARVSFALSLLIALTFAGPVAATGVDSGRPVTVRDRAYWAPPPTIDRTGKQDVGAELGHWLSRVPDGGVVLFPRGATYRIDSTVTLTDRHHIEIDGNASTLRAGTEGDRNRSHLRFAGGSDLRVHGLTIIGANPDAGVGEAAYRADREAQHAVELLGSARVQVDHITVHDVFGDGIYIGRSKDGRFSTQVWIHDTTIDRTGRQGISVTAGTGVVIEHNRISRTRRSTVDLEPNTPAWGASDILISDNEIGPGRLRFVAAHGSGPVDQVVIRGNRLTGRPLTIDVQPEAGARRSGFWIVDNVSDTPADRTPLLFDRVDGLVVRNNRQPVTAARALQGEVGVRAIDVCGLTIEANDFGPGTAPLHRSGRVCAPSAPPPVPAPPDIPGRPQVPGGPTLTTRATSPSQRRRTTPATPPSRSATTPRSDAETRGDGSSTPWGFIAVGALVVVGAIAVTARRMKSSSR